MPTTPIGTTFSDWLAAQGRRFTSWMAQTPLGKAGKAFVDAVNHRPDDTTARLIDVLGHSFLPGHGLATMLLSTMTGTPLPADIQEKIKQGADLTKDPGKFMEGMAAFYANNPNMRSAEEALGGLLDGLIVKPLEDMLDAGIDDPSAFIRRVHGVHAGLTLAAGAIGLMGEIEGAGQIKSVLETMLAMLENMGLSRIGFRTMSPLMEIGIGQPLGRYYARRYRPRRWTASELTQLYALREIDEPTFRQGMTEEGYRDSDIDAALHISEQRIAIGDIMKAYQLNEIDVGQTVNYLHRRGYVPEDIEFLIRLQDANQKQTDLDAIGAIALDAFKKDLISEAKFRQIRLDARVPQERIDLEVEIALLAKKANKNDVSISEIHSAYMNNVLARTEANKYLLDLNIDDTARILLLDTWDAEKKPKHLALNAATILRAYAAGLFDRGQTIDRLKSVGWSAEDAALQVDLQDTKSGGTVRQPSESVITTAYVDGLLTHEEALTRMKGIGLSEDNATLILRIADLKPKKGVRTLTDAQVIKLVKLGVFSVDDATSYMTDFLGYDNQTATLALIAGLESVPKPGA